MKAPFFHQEPKVPIQGLQLIPNLALKSGRPVPLGCSPPSRHDLQQSQLPSLLICSIFQQAIRKEGVIILILSLRTCFPTHIRLALGATGQLSSTLPDANVAPWPWLHRGTAMEISHAPNSLPKRTGRAIEWSSPRLNGVSNQSHATAVRETDIRSRRSKSP